MFELALKPFPQETVSHWLARHLDIFRFADNAQFIKSLTGGRNRAFAPDLPSRLELLIHQIPGPSSLTADYFIDHHTALPYYAPFLPPKRLSKTRLNMTKNADNNIHMQVGIAASNISSPTYYRYCVQCVAEDRNTFGECYWHLEHQLASVLVCPHHNSPLITTNSLMHQIKLRYMLKTAEWELKNYPTNPTHQIDNKDHDKLYQLAKDSFWLLSNGSAFCNSDFIHDRYFQLLVNQNLATFSGTIRMREVLSEFSDYYSDSLLKLFNCQLDSSSKENWLMRLLRKSTTTQHPIYHLLAMQFLDISAKEFFESPSPITPFGVGPWPCLNNVCSHYKRGVIQENELTYSNENGKPVGTFCCPSCQFTYSRLGPDKTESDKYKRSRIVSFGSLWETTLMTNWNDFDMSLRGLSRLLGVDTRTVKKQANRLKLDSRRPGSFADNHEDYADNEDKNVSYSSGIESKRKQWLGLIKSQPDAGVTQLRKLSPALYAWLYRNDRSWLRQHSPTLKSKTTVVSRRVDWIERDLVIAITCLQACLNLIQLNKRPTKITQTKIARASGNLASIQKCSKKLPITKSLVTQLSESRDEFAIRRIWWQALHLKQNGVYDIAEWKLVRLSGIARLKNESIIKQILNDALSWLKKRSQSSPNQNSITYAFQLIANFTIQS